jgi:hypothetical protein
LKVVTGDLEGATVELGRWGRSGLSLGADAEASDHPARAEEMQLLTSPLEPGTGRRDRVVHAVVRCSTRKTTTTGCGRCGGVVRKRTGVAGGDVNPSMAGQGLPRKKRILI